MDNKTVFISISHLKVMTGLHLLKEAGIAAHKIDKMDSAHAGLFGEIQIVVPQEDEAKAREILKEAEVL